MCLDGEPVIVTTTLTGLARLRSTRSVDSTESRWRCGRPSEPQISSPTWGSRRRAGRSTGDDSARRDRTVASSTRRPRRSTRRGVASGRSTTSPRSPTASTSRHTGRRSARQHGLRATDVIDHTYFGSVYFRTHGGALFEMATPDPGFTVDASVPALGTDLALPEWLVDRRAEIAADFPAIEAPTGDD